MKDAESRANDSHGGSGSTASGELPPASGECTWTDDGHPGQLQAILDEVPVAVYLVEGAEHVVRYANDASLNAFGGADPRGRSLREYLELERQVGAFIDQVLRSGEPVIVNELALEGQVSRGGGPVVPNELAVEGMVQETTPVRYLNMVFKPKRGQGGEVQGVLACGFDVTEQVNARRAAEAATDAWRLSEMQLRLAIRSSGLVVFGQDRALRHVWIHNPVPGFTPDRIIGKSDRELHTQENAEVLERIKLRALAGESVREEVALAWNDGVRHYQLTAEPHFDAAGAIDGLIGACVDISDEVRDREHLQRWAAELKAAVDLRDDFLSIAGHELKTPLAALLMHIQSLQRARQAHVPPQKLDERLAKAASSGVRLDKLINQMLDVSRITSGRLQLETETFSLEDVLHDIIERFAEQSERTGSHITLHVASRTRGTWDRLRIDQVFTNLVGNAMKYGNGQPIDVELDSRDGAAEVRVVDRGIGILASQQQKIFDRFERAVGTREFGGFGLGLWICRQIVEASGGRIAVTSAPEAGSTFTVWLPLQHREAPGA